MKTITYLALCLSIFVTPLIAKTSSGPDFLVIGAQKSGTSSLYYYLTNHPQITKAKGKEIHYFNRNFSKGIKWYKSQFPKKTKKSDFLTGEATPEYLFCSQIPKMVHDFFPKTKLIVILRNPVDRAFSHYKKNHRKNLRMGKENRSFEEELSTDLQIHEENSASLHDDAYYGETGLLRRGLYLEQIKRYLKFFPKKQLHIILTRDLENDPENTMNRLFQFLNLPNYTQSEYTRENVATNNQITLAPKTRKFLEDFYRPYNEELQNYLKEVLELDVTLDWD
ncbi:MAG: sulfotransferase domain-containing protein [Chlamydiota bacterium]